MDFYFDDFVTGINDQLKTAEEASIFDQTGAICPTITTQAKWRFARTPTHLQLHDGNSIYNFHLPEGEKDYDFPAIKEDHQAMHEFGKDAESQGTAQIHRADPGSIYFTLQDGRTNPTYTLKHVNGSQWRAMPKTKATQSVDKEAFIKGANDGMLDMLAKGVDGAARGAVRGTMALGHDPMHSMLGGLATGAAYDIGKRTLYNTPDENKEETGLQRLKRYLIPALLAGGVGAAAKNVFPNYYNEFPTYRP